MWTAYTLSQCSVISNLHVCECLQVKSHISLPAELLFWPDCLTRLHVCGMQRFRLLFRIPLVIKTHLVTECSILVVNMFFLYTHLNHQRVWATFGKPPVQ